MKNAFTAFFFDVSAAFESIGTDSRDFYAAVSGRRDDEPDELFDEESGRWFELPHPMAQPRSVARVVSLPAGAAAAR